MHWSEGAPYLRVTGHGTFCHFHHQHLMLDRSAAPTAGCRGAAAVHTARGRRQEDVIAATRSHSSASRDCILTHADSHLLGNCWHRGAACRRRRHRQSSRRRGGRSVCKVHLSKCTQNPDDASDGILDEPLLVHQLPPTDKANDTTTDHVRLVCEHIDGAHPGRRHPRAPRSSSKCTTHS